MSVPNHNWNCMRTHILPAIFALSVTILLIGCEAVGDTAFEEDEDAETRSSGEGIPRHLMIQAQVEGPLPPAMPLPLFSINSPWNQPIAPDATVDTNADEMMALFMNDIEKDGGGATLTVREWSVTVYVADENTPRVEVELTARWSDYEAMLDVPIPEWAIPDPEDDGEMTIIDLSTGYMYDLWQVGRNDDGNWTASWANRIPLDSDGIYPHGMSTRGAGFAQLAGMIWPEEFEQGINHALVVSLPHTANGGPVWPATESDGWSPAAGAIPEGARLQLDPTLDLDQYDMEPYERPIAEALQRYGAYVGDSTHIGVEFEVINPIGFPEDPYPVDWFTERYVILDGIPWEHMRVLEFGPQADPEIEVVDESIYRPR